jgi:hypothetical protein
MGPLLSNNLFELGMMPSVLSLSNLQWAANSAKKTTQMRMFE